MADRHPDSKLIDRLGGPAELARRLGFTDKGSIQRVQNWKRRGIPPLLWYQRQDIFGPPPPRRTTAASGGEGDAAETNGTPVYPLKNAA